MKKILILLFTDEVCKLNHAFMYANNLNEKGHIVKIIIERQATNCLNFIDTDTMLSKQFELARKSGLIYGACKRAAAGCSTNDEKRNVTSIAMEKEIDLFDDMLGHLCIDKFIEEDFQVLVF